MQKPHPFKPGPPQDPEPLSFPEQEEAARNHAPDDAEQHLVDTAEEIFATLDTMSRAIRDLARELNCLGFFDDDDDDSPKAA